MKTVVIYYSYTGNTKEVAQDKASKVGAELIEVLEVKRRGKLRTYLGGPLKGIRRKRVAIKQVDNNLSDFDEIIIATPIWASYPVPAFNNIVDLLPSEKQVKLIFTSKNGSSAESEEGTKALIKAKNCELVAYTDVKS